MTFKQLEHVLEIYKAGSVRRAAEQCYITQPALSQQLHRLEQELGFALFDHTASPLRPTAAGEHYLGVVQHIVQQHEQVLQWLRERPEEETGRVILGVTNTRSKIFLPALLPPFQKQHPDIRVVIQEEQTLQRLGELVSTGEVDLAHRMAAAGYGSTLVGDMMAKYDNFYNSLSYYPISDPPFL